MGKVSLGLADPFRDRTGSAAGRSCVKSAAVVRLLQGRDRHPGEAARLGGRWYQH